MKKALTLLAATLLLCASASAQTYLNVGYSRNNTVTTIDDTSSSKPSDGVYAGISHNFQLMGGLGIEAGINYMFDYASEALVSAADIKNITKNQGLSLPVELNYTIDLGLLAVRVFAGPTFHYGLSSKLSTLLASKEMIIDYYERETRTPFMVQGTVGASTDIFDKIRIKVGYNACLNDIDKADYSKLQKNMLSASVGYIF